MCIIMVKPKGVLLPDKNIFKNCFDNNPDGAGFMYTYKNQVFIKKGYNNVDDIYNDITNVLHKQDTTIVAHFRIGTHGDKKDAKATHPFPISSDYHDLQELNYVTNIGVAHNGIITGYYDTKLPELSDTQLFIRDVLSKLIIVNSEFYTFPVILKMLGKLTNSKLTFLDRFGNYYLVGDFVEKDGIYYSNTTYSYSYYKYYNNYPSIYNNAYNYDDDWDDYSVKNDIKNNIPNKELTYNKSNNTPKPCNDIPFGEPNIYVTLNNGEFAKSKNPLKVGNIFYNYTFKFFKPQGNKKIRFAYLAELYTNDYFTIRTNDSKETIIKITKDNKYYFDYFGNVYAFSANYDDFKLVFDEKLVTKICDFNGKILFKGKEV